MSRMVRKQIVIDPELEHRLAERAERLGRSQSELVREALAVYLERDEADERLGAMDRFLMTADEVRASGVAIVPLTREEAHERAVLRGFERGDLPVRREGAD